MPYCTEKLHEYSFRNVSRSGDPNRSAALPSSTHAEHVPFHDV
jgi:hypothetical protein